MKRAIPIVLAVGLAATWVGCESATESETPSATAADTAGTTLVSLSVPNMT